MFLAKKKQVIKLVLILATFTRITNTSKNDITLDHILYIHYLVSFWKSNYNIEILIHSKNEVNIMTLIYTSK